MSYASLINLIQGQLNPRYIFQFLNSQEGWDYTQQFLYIWSHAFCPRAISHLPHSVISGGMSLQWSDLSPHGGPLRSFQGNLLFNLKTHSLHKCFPHCPLQSIKEILPRVSTIFGILLMLHELCPPICAFQCSHLCDLCRKECCLQKGRNLIQSNPPCDFIMQGTKNCLAFHKWIIIWILLTLLLLWPVHHLWRLKKQNQSGNSLNNLHAQPHNHCI